MRTTIRDVAKEAGVAVSSVSRALSGHPDVSDELRARVQAAADRLGYRTNLVAQSFKTKTTHTIGFLVSDITNPLMAEITLGAERALAPQGYSVMLTNSEGDPELDAERLELFDQRRVDGLLLSLASERHRKTLDVLRQIDAPKVLIDRRMPKDIGASAVWSDHRPGIEAAVDHLVNLGHHAIGLITGHPMRPSQERRRAFQDAADRAGIGASVQMVGGSMSEAFGESACGELMAGPTPPTALIVGGNQLVVGVLRALRARGLAVGGDVSVVACDDIPVTELHDPPIAVITRDLGELGRVAAQLLLDRLGGAGPSEVVLSTAYEPRASVAPPPSAG